MPDRCAFLVYSTVGKSSWWWRFEPAGEEHGPFLTKAAAYQDVCHTILKLQGAHQ
jgi:hypothetical protein